MATQTDLLLHLKSAGYAKSIRVVSAMDHVDRRHFVVNHENSRKCSTTVSNVHAGESSGHGHFHEKNPYDDVEQHFAYGVNISSPRTHAIALESLKENLHKSNRALDVGYGSGYLTACMAVLVGDHGRVIGVDNLPDLLPLATECISNALPHAISSGQIQLITGDGRLGCPEHAPYDVIHVGAAVDKEIPEALLDQLKPMGLLLAPVNGRFQLIEKGQDGSLTETDLGACKETLEPLGDPKSAAVITEHAQHQHKPSHPKPISLVDTNAVPQQHPHAPVRTMRKVEPATVRHSHSAETNPNIVNIKHYSYDKRHMIGKGKFGTVYKGYRISDGAQVAVKHINSIPDTQEWQILEVVKNPYILSLLDHFPMGPADLYVITELCDCDLRKFLFETGGTFNVDNTRVAAHQLAKGYMALFSADIIHRDIKPANILVEKLEQGARLKLADFGCGKILDKLDYAQTIVGASGYLAPEVIFRHYNAKADVWSLGLVIYECFFGDRFQQTFVEPDSTLGVAMLDSDDPDLNEMLLKMLQYDQNNRMSPTEFFGNKFHSSVPNGALIKVKVGYEKV